MGNAKGDCGDSEERPQGQDCGELRRVRCKIEWNGDEVDRLADQKLRFNNPSKSWGVDLFDDLDGA